MVSRSKAWLGSIRRAGLARTALVAFLVTAAVPVAAVAADFAIHAGRIHSGVSVSGVDVGRMTRQVAARRLRALGAGPLSRPVLIEYGKLQWKLRPTDIRFRVDFDDSTRVAFAVGRRRGLPNQVAERFSAWYRATPIPVSYGLDEGSLATAVDRIAKEIDVKPVDAGVRIEGTRPSVTAGRNGLRIDQTGAVDAIRVALAEPSRRIVRLEARTARPQIGRAEAAAAAAVVEQMVSGPIDLRYKDKAWEVKPEEIAGLIAYKVERRGATWALTPVFDEKKLDTYLQKHTKSVAVPAKDARFTIVRGKVVIVASSEGRRIDSKSANVAMLVAAKSDSRRVFLSTEVVEPKLTTEKAQGMGIKEKISSFTTYFNPAQLARVNNIKLFTDALDGLIVPAGEVLSLNEAVGPRTAAKGYDEAPVIINGQLVPALGGGICQVATTVFNTVFFSGYPVLERRNHTLYISQYPRGRDATVSYGGVDLKFRNDTTAYLLIKGSYTTNSVTIAFYSTDVGTKVTYTTSPFSRLTPYSTKYVQDSTLLKGQRVVEEQGVMGRDVTVIRTVTRGGKRIREDRFFSRYVPRPAIVRVGTKEPPPAPAPAPTSKGANDLEQ